MSRAAGKTAYRFDLAGYYLDKPHPGRGGFWYACRYDARTRKVRRRSLGTTDFEKAKIALAEIVASAPRTESEERTPGPDGVLTLTVLQAYLDGHGSQIASGDVAERAVQLITEYLQSIERVDATVAFWTPSQQLEFARWCVTKHQHSAGYVERLFNVMRAAFNNACVIRLRHDAIGQQIECALMTNAPRVVWKRVNVAHELKIPGRRRMRPDTPTLEQMAALLDALKTPHLFRFVIMSLCTWARPQAMIDFDPHTQIQWNNFVLDLAPPDWVQTTKRRPHQPLTQCMSGWLPVWDREDRERIAHAREKGEERSRALITYKGKKVESVKRAIRRIGAEVGLEGFSQKSFRHFMSDQVKKLGVSRELRSRWLGHVVREGSETTAHYEGDDPQELVPVALATDYVLTLIQQHCLRRLFAIEPLLNRDDLEAIGIRSPEKSMISQGVHGGRDRDRTCDPYHVKVVLFR
jgi:integrase